MSGSYISDFAKSLSAVEKIVEPSNILFIICTALFFDLFFLITLGQPSMYFVSKKILPNIEYIALGFVFLSIFLHVSSIVISNILALILTQHMRREKENFEENKQNGKKIIFIDDILSLAVRTSNSAMLAYHTNIINEAKKQERISRLNFFLLLLMFSELPSLMLDTLTSSNSDKLIIPTLLQYTPPSLFGNILFIAIFLIAIAPTFITIFMYAKAHIFSRNNLVYLLMDENDIKKWGFDKIEDYSDKEEVVNETNLVGKNG